MSSSEPVRVLAACAAFDCPACDHYRASRCRGCAIENRELAEAGKECCAVFRCVQEHALESCDYCTAVLCPHLRLGELCVVGSRYGDEVADHAEQLTSHLAGHQERMEESRSLLGAKAVVRLRWYLHALDRFQDEGLEVASSWDIGRKVGVKPGLVRKDLSYLRGPLGTPSVGYHIDSLRRSLQEVFSFDRVRRCAWVGARALLADPSLLNQSAKYNFECVAIFDADSKLIGKPIWKDVQAWPLEMMPQAVKELGISCAAVAIGDELAQRAADLLVAAGVRAILNLTGVPLVVPPGVMVHQADPVTQLFMLAYYSGT